MVGTSEENLIVDAGQLAIGLKVIGISRDRFLEQVSRLEEVLRFLYVNGLLPSSSS